MEIMLTIYIPHSNRLAAKTGSIKMAKLNSVLVGLTSCKRRGAPFKRLSISRLEWSLKVIFFITKLMFKFFTSAK